MTVRTWIIAAISLIAVAFFGGSQCAARNRGALEERVRIADSVAVAKQAEAAGDRNRAREEHARAEREKQRAESLTVVATSAGTAVRSAVTRAGTARAAVPESVFTTLPTTVRHALEEGDSLRVAITPMIERYESALAAHRSTEARLELTIAKQDSALSADSVALAARASQVAALTQLQAPRCGWRCGLVVGLIGSVAWHNRSLIAGALP